MSDLPTPPSPSSSSTGRPRPILLAQSMLAAVQVIVGAAGFAEHVPAGAAWWIVTGLAAVQIGLAFYLQSRTTPLSSPQDARGVPLVPVDAVPPPVVSPPATTTGRPVVSGDPFQLGSTRPGATFPTD